MGSDTTPEGRKLQMEVAENKLRTGGGLFGKKGGIDLLNQGSKTASIGVGMPINPYLWKASLETKNFKPLSSADPFAGLKTPKSSRFSGAESFFLSNIVFT